MRKAIKRALESARFRNTTRQEIVPNPSLVSSQLVEVVVQEINNGESLTIPDVMSRLRCKKDKAIRLVRARRGVAKVGKSYLIPQSVFHAIIRESLVA